MRRACLLLSSMMLVLPLLGRPAAAQSPQSAAPVPGDGRAQFAAAVETGRFDDARQLATALLGAPGQADLLDELTYQLATAGGGSDAVMLLLDAYPFRGRAAEERERLLDRLTFLLLGPDGREGPTSSLDVTAALATPLDTPALRSRQAAFWTELSYAYAREGHRLEARRAMEHAAALDADSATIQMELGWMAWREARWSDARAAFERAWELDRDPAAAEQLVYVYQRLHDNQMARTHAEHVLDARRPARAAPVLDFAADRRYGLQRLHEDLGRRVTVNLDAWSGPRAGTGIGTVQTGRAYSSYSQLEVDLRLGAQPVRNNTTLSAFARLVSDAGPEQRPWPSRNPTLGIGLRWKPLRHHVFFLSAEGQTGLDDATRRDVLLRASASFLNGGRFSDDWHPTGTGWFAHNLYLDAAYYVWNERSGMTGDYRASYHGKVTGNQTMEPYVRLQANGLHAAGFDHDVRGGAGVRWNLWYGASRYDAPRHKLSLGVEMQQTIDSTLVDGRSVFFTLGSRW